MSTEPMEAREVVARIERPPMTHVVKCVPPFFEEVWTNRKLFEVRLNDRDYREGDDIIQREYLPDASEFTGRETMHRVGFVLHDYPALASDHVAFSLLPIIAALGGVKEDSSALAESAAAGPSACAAKDAQRKSEKEPDEITEYALRSRARILVVKKGWRPGDKPSMHSIVELMTAFGMDLTRRPVTDRCAYPECGCDHDEVCDAALSSRTEAPAAAPFSLEALLAERLQDPEWLAKWNASEEERKPFVELLHDLRAEEGATVTLLCDNPDFNGQPNNAIEVCGSWTGWVDRRFTGDTLHGAVLAAYRAKNPSEAPTPDPPARAAISKAEG